MSSLLSASHRVLLGLIGAALPLAAAVAEPEGKARTAYDFAPSDAGAPLSGCGSRSRIRPFQAETGTGSSWRRS